MYTVDAAIVGTAGLLQHAFGQRQLVELRESAKKLTGAPDYSQEWLDTMYVTKDGYLYQPATHLEGALQRAASAYKVKGQRGKTWRDAVKAYAYVQPEEILHYRNDEWVRAPGPELLETPTEYLSVDVKRVKVQRAAVARSRLLIAPGWELRFKIEVIDDQLDADVLHTIFQEAGRAVGIGDYRPRYGRFQVERFEVNP